MNAPISLEEIIQFDAAYCRDVSIKVCRKLGTVCIMDEAGENEDIFLQGDEGERWIGEFDRLVAQAPEVSFEAAMKHLAKPYVDAIWN